MTVWFVRCVRCVRCVWCACVVVAMLTCMDRQNRVIVTLRMDPAELAAADTAARTEQRSRSQMLRILIVEALTARTQTANTP